uniref:Uncharacterized protein n=1 Tax=Arundo donax TaxID=35708 RepID=A0A0A8XQG5_ARUDO
MLWDWNYWPELSTPCWNGCWD